VPLKELAVLSPPYIPDTRGLRNEGPFDDHLEDGKPQFDFKLKESVGSNIRTTRGRSSLMRGLILNK